MTVEIFVFYQEVVSSEPQILMTSTGEPIYQVNTEQELLASLSQVSKIYLPLLPEISYHFII